MGYGYDAPLVLFMLFRAKDRCFDKLFKNPYFRLFFEFRILKKMNGCHHKTSTASGRHNSNSEFNLSLKKDFQFTQKVPVELKKCWQI